MIVKNPTGITQVYSYLGETLTAGATATVDDSFNENAQLHTDVAAGIIAIISYTKDEVSQVVTIKTSTTPLAPSQEQKAALVASDSPSVDNPFVTQKCNPIRDILIEQGATTSSIKLTRINSGKYLIGNTLINHSSEFETTIGPTTPLVDSAGVSSGTMPVAGIVHIYLTSTGFIFSLSAPVFSENGLYLNTTRNALFVGWLTPNALSELEHSLSVCSYFNEPTKTLIDIPSGAVQSISVTSTFESVLLYSVVLPPGYSFELNSRFPLRDTLTGNMLNWGAGPVAAVTTWQASSVAEQPVYGLASHRVSNPTANAGIGEARAWMKSTSATTSFTPAEAYVQITRRRN